MTTGSRALARGAGTTDVNAVVRCTRKWRGWIKRRPCRARASNVKLSQALAKAVRVCHVASAPGALRRPSNLQPWQRPLRALASHTELAACSRHSDVAPCADRVKLASPPTAALLPGQQPWCTCAPRGHIVRLVSDGGACPGRDARHAGGAYPKSSPARRWRRRRGRLRRPLTTAVNTSATAVRRAEPWPPRAMT